MLLRIFRFLLLYWVLSLGCYFLFQWLWSDADWVGVQIGVLAGMTAVVYAITQEARSISVTFKAPPKEEK